MKAIGCLTPLLVRERLVPLLKSCGAIQLESRFWLNTAVWLKKVWRSVTTNFSRKGRRMPSVTVQEITKFIEKNIPDFHRRRLENLGELKLRKVLRRKNPYSFKAKFVISAPDLVKLILDAHLSSQEETIFGGFLEGLAVFICGHVFLGKKSSAEGIDLEFERDGIHYIVSIQSG